MPTRVAWHRAAVPLIVAVAFIAAWSLGIALTGVSRALLPSPTAVLGAGLELVEGGELARHVRVSALRLLIGFLLSVALALPIAMLFARLRGLRAVLEPPLEFLRQVPPLAMMPLLILWLGIGEAQKVGIITLACFFPVFLGTLGGIAQCDRRLIEVGQVAGLSKGAILCRIVMPSALPSTVVGLRIALGQGWRALVGAELVASSAGLGYMIEDAQNLARTDIVIVGVLVIGTLGLASDWAFRRAIAATWPWVKVDGGDGDA
ncbi:ABC transporter permease [Xanthobacteraceae bacterium Astr-EGSB]|uniref:ABC transporter permease n=1 Tax=Astrobacterium formosum TaxID=3069710 RepID=UPI0027AEF812|nr:ABC transporter permease [Xanthobacteraceae bacterium Astr-EGSB]